MNFNSILIIPIFVAFTSLLSLEGRLIPNSAEEMVKLRSIYNYLHLLTAFNEVYTNHNQLVEKIGPDKYLDGCTILPVDCFEDNLVRICSGNWRVDSNRKCLPYLNFWLGSFGLKWEECHCDHLNDISPNKSVEVPEIRMCTFDMKINASSSSMSMKSKFCFPMEFPDEIDQKSLVRNISEQFNFPFYQQCKTRCNLEGLSSYFCHRFLTSFTWQFWVEEQCLCACNGTRLNEDGCNFRSQLEANFRIYHENEHLESTTETKRQRNTYREYMDYYG